MIGVAAHVSEQWDDRLLIAMFDAHAGSLSVRGQYASRNGDWRVLPLRFAISAYLWGWLRFLPEAKVIRFVRFLRPFDRLFQIGTLVIEVGAVFILFDQWLCLGLMAMFIVFQSMVATLSGVLFWQHMVVNALLVATRHERKHQRIASAVLPERD